MKSKQMWILAGIVCLVIIGVVRMKKRSVVPSLPGTQLKTPSAPQAVKTNPDPSSSAGNTASRTPYKPASRAVQTPRVSPKDVPNAKVLLMNDEALAREQFKRAAEYYLATEQSAQKTLDSLEACIFNSAKGPSPQMTDALKSKMNPDQKKALEKMNVTMQAACVSAAELIIQKYPKLAPEVERRITRRALPEAVKRAVNERKAPPPSR